jgi:transposase
MSRIPNKKSPSAAGAETQESVAPAPAAVLPELLGRPLRRKFTAKDKLRILGEVDRAAGVLGGIGAILRREGLYSSALTDWRRQREVGAYEALSRVKRGAKPAESNPLAAGNARLRQDNACLARKLVHAEAIIEIQKKSVCASGAAGRKRQRHDGRPGGSGA